MTAEVNGGHVGEACNAQMIVKNQGRIKIN